MRWRTLLRADGLSRLTSPDRAVQADEPFSAQPATITSLLTGLRRDHGSLEAYAAAAGPGPEVVARLRGALLE